MLRLSARLQEHLESTHTFCMHATLSPSFSLYLFIPLSEPVNKVRTPSSLVREKEGGREGERGRERGRKREKEGGREREGGREGEKERKREGGRERE